MGILIRQGESQMKKQFSMYSNGVVLASVEGKVRKANKKEVIQHLASLLPETYKDQPLSKIMYNSEDCHVYGKYGNKTVRKALFEKDEDKDDDKDEDDDKDKDKDKDDNKDDKDDKDDDKKDDDGDDDKGEKKWNFEKKKDAATDKDEVKVADKQTEPVNSVDKADPDVKVPENAAKAKPETAKITKDRPDVATPKKVRKEEYTKGKGGEDLHTDVVPRSKSDGGLKGGSVAETTDETSNKATSGKPDTYVQNFEKSEEPAKAGSEMNHAAGNEIEIRPEAQMYQNLNLSKESKDIEPQVEKTAAKQETTKAMPWEGKTDEESDGRLQKELRDLKSENKELKAEINKGKVIVGRNKAATEYALSLYQLNPAKYADPSVFNQVVEDTATKMDVHAISTMTDELKIVHAEKERSQAEIKEATLEGFEKVASTDEGLATAIVIPETEGKNGKTSDDLKDILMSGTSLGRMIDEHDELVNQ